MIVPLLLAASIALGVDIETQTLCRELVDDEEPAYDVVASDMPEIQIDRSDYFSLEILGHVIPIPNVEFDKTIVRQVDNSIRFIQIESKSEDLKVFLSFMDVSDEPMSGIASNQEAMEVMYRTTSSDVNCETLSKDDAKLMLALVLKSVVDGDMCSIDAVYQTNDGWVINGGRQDCGLHAGRFVWKFRSDVKSDSFFEVRWNLNSNENYQNIGYIFNGGKNNFHKTPQEFKELSHCIERDDVQCLLDIKGLEVNTIDSLLQKTDTHVTE